MTTPADPSQLVALLTRRTQTGDLRWSWTPARRLVPDRGGLVLTSAGDLVVRVGDAEITLYNSQISDPEPIRRLVRLASASADRRLIRGVAAAVDRPWWRFW